jgi:endogenous inhibitor of DNA gyrase (YacG/DUF329 family)
MSKPGPCFFVFSPPSTKLFSSFFPFPTPRVSQLALGSWEEEEKTVGARLQEDGRHSGLRGTSGLWLALCLGWSSA